MYFAENPNFSKLDEVRYKKRKNIVKVGTISPAKSFDVIGINHLQATLGDYEQNPFVRFLLNLFPEDVEAVWKAIKSYFVGTFEGKAVFWQIDQSRRIRTGKMMLYNALTGKRIAETFTNRNGETIEIKTNWIHARLKKQGKLKEDFSLKQCYFGEHLLKLEAEKPIIAIVESEKTALIASICFPEFLWLATGGKQNLNIEGLKRLGLRKIILYPDSDGFNKWQEIALKARGRGLDVKLSSLIENRTEGAEKAEGYDLADYLINEANEINEFNAFADRYNNALEKTLSARY